MINLNDRLKEAEDRASKEGSIIGIVSRAEPIEHSQDKKEIEIEIPFDSYVSNKILVGSFLGISTLFSNSLILGRVKGIRREDLRAISRIPSLTVVKDVSSLTTPVSIILELISEELESGDVVPPSSPIDPQSPVFIPKDDFVKRLIGLEDNGIPIGKIIEGYATRNVDVVLNEDMLRHHILIVGTTGSGKTNLMKIIASRSTYPLMIFDIEGDYIPMIAKEGGVLIEPITQDYASGMNVTKLVDFILKRSGISNYKIDSVDSPNITVKTNDGEFMLTFVGFRLDSVYKELSDATTLFSPQGAYFFKMAIEEQLNKGENITIYEWDDEWLKDYKLAPSTIGNISRVVRLIQDMGIIDVRWNLLGKEEYFDEPNYNILLKKKSVVDLRWVMEKGMLSAVTTSYILASRIFEYKDAEYKQGKKITTFLLMFDEAHEYFPQSQREENKESLERLINKIMRLGRKRGIGTILATHRPEDLNDLVITLANTKMALRADEDALDRIGMKGYAKVLDTSPPGLAFLKTYAYKTHEIGLKVDKYE